VTVVLCAMAIEVPRELDARFNAKLAAGTYRSAEELLDEALRLIEERDALRLAIAQGAAEADRGELIPGEQVFEELDALLAEMERTDNGG